jgi:hypothetical protein
MFPSRSYVSEDEIEQRRRELIRKNWDQELAPSERRELRLLETKLDRYDQDRDAPLKRQQEQLLERQRSALNSLEKLVKELRGL